MVALYAGTLLLCRASLHARQHTPLVKATRFLHRDYRIDCFYWELIELNRRTILTGWVLLFPTDRTFLRLVVAQLLSIVSLTLLLCVQPYHRIEDNGIASLDCVVNHQIRTSIVVFFLGAWFPRSTVLAACCQLTLAFSFIGAGYTRLFEDFIDKDVALTTVHRVMVFPSTTSIVGPLIVLTTAMVVVMLAMMAFSMLSERRLPIIRLQATGQPPRLTLAFGLKWQLFLSHTWATGQEYMARDSNMRMIRARFGLRTFATRPHLRGPSCCCQSMRSDQATALPSTSRTSLLPRCGHWCHRPHRSSKPFVTHLISLMRVAHTLAQI